MSRFTFVDPATATGATQQLLDGVRAKLGAVPNMLRGLAASPAALAAYLDFSSALAGGQLSAPVREQVALLVAEINGCSYCLAAHSALGARFGLSADDTARARQGLAADPKTAALLALAKQLVVRRGEVREADLVAARSAGIGDGEIAELVGAVALNVFTNYFNHLADPVIDFPAVKQGIAGGAVPRAATASGSV